MNQIVISNQPASLKEWQQVLIPGATIILSDLSKEAILRGRTYLDEKLSSHNEPIYGINTGFGALYNTRIEAKDLQKLQENLVRSHACGMGEPVPEEVIKLMMYLKIRGLSYGNSGVQLSTVQRLVDMFNEGIWPVVYQQGSLGASGDLAPLAHLSLPLLGEGEVFWNRKRVSSAEVLRKLGWSPINLQSKEGLALLNGTQFMSAYGAWICMQAIHLWEWATFIGSVSLDAFDGRTEPFYPSLHTIRPHNGQIIAADRMRKYLSGSSIAAQAKKHVQDPYSFRCIPQVHGASWDAIQYALKVFEIECNSVTDNPTLFPDEDLILSGGNFHGQPLALALDFLSIALHELGSISERRIYQLINGNRELPAFLTPFPGINSGFMIAQYSAASMVSQNKTLCMPASADTIDSSRGQEDHVSMGANAATKAYRITKNLYQILSIELMTAIQALDFRKPLVSSDSIEKLRTEFRKVVPFIEQDTLMYPLFEKSVEFLEQHQPSEYA
ncbi:MAG: histidine ammonia-lyase [Flavobacteriales bacterium]|nr:histidine ammonia-lyase [Flavobacteriales bacterium]